MPMSESGVFEPFERNEIFAKLSAMMQGRSPPLALVGAGASRGSGYPDWPGLTKELRELAGPSGNIPKKQEVLSDDASWEAEVHFKAIGAKAFFGFIGRRFGNPQKLAQPHIQIARMPFRHYLTTNYDPCIELSLTRAKRKFNFVKWEDDVALSKFLMSLSSSGPETSVVYLHGRYDDPRHAILTESSYVDRYIKNDDARRKLLAIFMTHPVVFIGFSMTDPDLANLMREVTARLRSDPPSHFAIMGYGSEPERDVYRERMRGKFGVEPIFYSYTKSGGDKHANLKLLLEALSPGSLDNGSELGGHDHRGGGTESAQIEIEPTPIDPNDPAKNQWGGSPRANGRHLLIKLLGGSERSGFLELDVIVEAEEGHPELTGDVTFYLHPTFDPAVETIKARKGRAVLKIIRAYGAFTIGVSADAGQTRLELDLALLTTLPNWFRRR